MRLRDHEPIGHFVSLPARYGALSRTLQAVSDMLTAGKGEARHGRGRPLEDQPALLWARRHGITGQLYQIQKKADEAMTSGPEDQRRELLSLMGEALLALVALEAAPPGPKPRRRRPASRRKRRP